jgi:hypothetical protein
MSKKNIGLLVFSYLVFWGSVYLFLTWILSWHAGPALFLATTATLAQFWRAVGDRILEALSHESDRARRVRLRQAVRDMDREIARLEHQRSEKQIARTRVADELDKLTPTPTYRISHPDDGRFEQSENETGDSVRPLARERLP